MQSYDFTSEFYFQADAHTVGGTLVRPLQKVIPPQASASLPVTGGFATNRAEAFNLDDIVSCASSATLVSGRRSADGTVSVLVKSEIEGLNILNVVTAERLVAQISVECPGTGGLRRISVVGSQFVGLRLGGVEARPHVVPELLQPKPGENGSLLNLTRRDFERIGRAQADELLGCVGADFGRGAHAWVEARFGWMTNRSEGEDGECSLSSLVGAVTGVNGAIPGRTLGHVIELPGFGRIFLGEVLTSRRTLQLTMVRAELGCAVGGSVGAGVVANGGHTVPPVKTD